MLSEQAKESIRRDATLDAKNENLDYQQILRTRVKSCEDNLSMLKEMLTTYEIEWNRVHHSIHHRL